jgi:hypothetical protein
MSFCGTIALNRRWKMLGFAMHCSALAHKLLDLKYKRDNIDKTPAGDQIRMFYLTTEDREDFAKFAANLKFLITPWTNEHNEEYWAEYRKHEYTDYDFHKLFDPLYAETKTAPVVALLERVGNGEELSEEETKIAMDFLHMLSARAHAETDEGGCF